MKAPKRRAQLVRRSRAKTAHTSRVYYNLNYSPCPGVLAQTVSDRGLFRLDLADKGNFTYSYWKFSDDHASLRIYKNYSLYYNCRFTGDTSARAVLERVLAKLTGFEPAYVIEITAAIFSTAIANVPDNFFTSLVGGALYGANDGMANEVSLHGVPSYSSYNPLTRRLTITESEFSNVRNWRQVKFLRIQSGGGDVMAAIKTASRLHHAHLEVYDSSFISAGVVYLLMLGHLKTWAGLTIYCHTADFQPWRARLEATYSELASSSEPGKLFVQWRGRVLVPYAVAQNNKDMTPSQAWLYYDESVWTTMLEYEGGELFKSDYISVHLPTIYLVTWSAFMRGASLLALPIVIKNWLIINNLNK